MSEVIKAKLRVKEAYMTDPIATKAAVATAAWGDALPCSFRDDELIITEEEPEEEPVYSHENDSPEEVDFDSKGLKMGGSFIRVTREELVELMGGSTTGGKYERPTKKLILSKAFKFVCHDGSEVIIPNAQGAVTMNLNLGKNAVSKFPFKFNLKRASKDWDCDIMF